MGCYVRAALHAPIIHKWKRKRPISSEKLTIAQLRYARCNALRCLKSQSGQLAKLALGIHRPRHLFTCSTCKYSLFLHRMPTWHCPTAKIKRCSPIETSTSVAPKKSRLFEATFHYSRANFPRSYRYITHCTCTL